MTHVLIALTYLLHGHTGQWQHTVEDCLQRSRHSVAVKRIAEDQKVAFEDLLKNRLHIIVVYALSAVMHAGETARTVLDVLVDGIYPDDSGKDIALGAYGRGDLLRHNNYIPTRGDSTPCGLLSRFRQQ